jgi:hypothetical protein
VHVSDEILRLVQERAALLRLHGSPLSGRLPAS